MAIDFDIQLIGGATIPIGNELLPDGTPMFGAVGGGGTLNADMEIFGFLSPYVEAGFFAVPGNNTGTYLSLVNGGGGLGLFFYPITRLKAGIGGGGGWFMFTYPGATTSWNYYWKARAELGFRFSPFLVVSAVGEYTQYMAVGGINYSGITAGVAMDVNLGILTNRTSGVAIEGAQSAPVFPLFSSEYDRTPLGTISVTNSEQAEIRDVTVSFNVANLSSKSMECARYPVIQKGDTVTAPLYAAFNEQVYTLTENTKVQAEIVVTYSLLDAPITVKKAITVAFNHRNATTWKDARMIAAFASPNDPALLEYSKFIAGLVRNKIRPGIDSNLQYAMGFYEALRLSGIAFSADPATPYAAYHVDPTATDYLQYPHQTLSYKSGDADDLAILYAAALESVGIKSAFIPLADDMCVAIPLLLSESEARSTFIDPSLLIYREGTPWLPVRISVIREGFLAAWLGGAKAWNDMAASGSTPQFYDTEKAWETFPPVGIPGIEAKVPKPSEEQVGLAFENALSRFITREIGPRVEKLLSEIKPSGGTPRQYNSLGILYARNGLLKEAQAAFQKAAATDYAPALTNLASVFFLQKDYENAVVYFQRVLARQPDNTTVLIGLARAKYELGEYTESDALAIRVRNLDPALAEKYSYLFSQIEGSAARAASAGGRGDMVWSGEDD